MPDIDTAPTAHLIRDVDQPRIAWIGGSTHGVALDAAATDSRLTVLRSSLRGGSGAPVHVHPNEDETLYFLSGTAAIWAGHDRWDAGAGDTVFLPRALPHTYLITSEAAELLTICTPSGMERFFLDAGWDLRDGPVPDGWAVDMAALEAAAANSGQIILGPPLAADELMPERALDWRSWAIGS